MNVLYALAVLLYCLSVQADDATDAAKRLSQFYYKGSEIEQRLNTAYSNLPLQLRASLVYFAPLNTIFIERQIVLVWTFP